MIVDLRRVEAGDGDVREKMAEQIGAGLGQLVQHERTAGELGKDGEQAGAGRRFQNPIGRRDGRRGDAASPSGTGVENCWSAWLSSERRVWVGKGPRSWPASAAWRPETRL